MTTLAAAPVADVLPLVAAESENCERLGTMPPVVVDALRDSGLFALMVPRELGGGEAGVCTVLTTFEDLCAADASIGWSYMANVTSSAMCAYLGDDAVHAMFGPQPAIMAGQFSPKGPAVAVEGGYRVSGRYAFGSGTAHSDWIGGGAIEMQDGPDGPASAIRMVDGRPVLRVYFVPRTEVEFLGGWDVMGLIGTGSFDYAISEREVPAGFTFELTNPQQRRGGPIYGLGVLGMTSLGHAGFALGVSRRALSEIVALAPRKQRLGHPTPVAGIERFQYELGRHSAMLRAARAFVFEVFTHAERVLAAGGQLTDDERLSLRQATTHVTHVSRDVADFAYHWAGADGIRPGAMQRLWRDTHTSTQHIFVDDTTMTDYGKQLLANVGSPPG